MTQASIDMLFGNGGSGPRYMEATIAYGKINLSNASLSVASFRVQGPFKRESAVNTGKRRPGFDQYVHATAHPQIGGGFSTNRVQHEPGTILLFQISRTRNRVRISDGAIFLRLREGAAFLAVSAKLPTGRESLLGDQYIIFQGNADLLSVEELKTSGLEIARQYERNFMSREEIEENFQINIVSPESTPRPSLQRVVSDGKVVVREMAQEPVRRIGRLRRSSV